MVVGIGVERQLRVRMRVDVLADELDGRRVQRRVDGVQLGSGRVGRDARGEVGERDGGVGDEASGDCLSEKGE